jgi:NAD(P)-dependent dehydrogenase (short-subunit alcohol dehydrogenase family)
MSTVSVVTGAAGAMGASCAGTLAPEVDVLLLTDVARGPLDAVGEKIARTTGTRVSALPGDLTDAHFVADLARAARDLGTVHSLVQTAGLSPTMAGWQQILRVDHVAVVAVLDAFLPAVGPGSVAVCIASIAGHLGAFDPAMDAVLDDPFAPDFDDRFRAAFGGEPDPGSTYRLAKRGVIRTCERAAVAWGARGGRVVSLSPGMIDTEMGRLELEHQPIAVQMAQLTPVGAGRSADGCVLPGLPADIADAVRFLCSDAAGFVSGCDLRVDGGLVGAMRQPNEG